MTRRSPTCCTRPCGGERATARRRRQRTVVEPAIQAITQAKVLAQQDLQATIGMFEASMGQPSNEQSGVAIDKRKIEAEGTNFTYSANLAWSIRALGTMCVEILPKLIQWPWGVAPGVA